MAFVHAQTIHLRGMEEDMERLFKDLAATKNLSGGFCGGIWRPPTDVYETERHILIRMEIAGMRQEHFRLHLEGNVLAIRGRRECPYRDRKGSFSQMEIHSGLFEAVVRLPQSSEASSIRASYKEGFLEIVVPKTRPSMMEIPIET
ncbi:MAG: Hsp20/alpha crystallin family protein [Candidatus Latescibacterota bacterium]